ncbi:MAG: hypothetical protein V6Z86_05170 [Hyphomicrobiales bacterium]
MTMLSLRVLFIVHIIFYSLWAIWTAVFIATGWAEGEDAWFGALGAGFVLTCVTMLPITFVLGLFAGVVLSLRGPAEECLYWAQDMRDHLRKRFGRAPGASRSTPRRPLP